MQKVSSKLKGLAEKAERLSKDGSDRYEYECRLCCDLGFQRKSDGKRMKIVPCPNPVHKTPEPVKSEEGESFF